MLHQFEIKKEAIQMKIEGNGFDVKTFQQQQPQQNRIDSLAERAESSPIKNQKPQQVESVLTPEENKAKSEHEVIQAIEKANKHIRMYDRRLEFSIHDATKQIMVKVIDTENNSVIREIPSEKILDLVAHLWQVAGILVDEKR